MTAVGVSVRIIVLNTNPCVMSYAGGGTYGSSLEYTSTVRTLPPPLPPAGPPQPPLPVRGLVHPPPRVHDAT